ncbi:hypothetical protein EJ05DRAFT_512806 [Pseudovirgaria hyperparasitica]|uniref:RNI-like protein n=1 Tax=Pseudovirgaria hyperparasitica TaxID=470096 RepID=A0A6A6W5E7_9PEZI|nr:uncharacterized protein EJ05DRAFT_512806 [Pseudovirgaria hyperparasitica]KAF2756281.1 hypothetical protein EJ05DRAFT_512806 [Pseudovirgaria hyperparasitica]
MNDELPSYDHAVSRDHWNLVARYIRSRDLCAAVLVCKEWYRILQPHLWGSPASHFGIANDAAYIALTRFKRTLSWASLSTRLLTHTLRLPPAHAEMYGGPHSDWLRDVLERLPRLQALIVRAVPFFDHSALHTVRVPSSKIQGFFRNVPPSYSLRLLDASATPNATSSGLATLLRHLKGLVYLDLSRTLAAKDVTVFESLRELSSLRILKLRQLGLRDEDISTIAQAVRTRVASLDLRENRITDIGVGTLIQHCIPPGRHSSEPHLYLSTSHAQNPWRGKASLDTEVARTLTTRTVGPLAIEEDQNSGISEVYMSNNPITPDSVTALLEQDLRVLDVGSVNTRNNLPSTITRPSPDDPTNHTPPASHPITHALSPTTPSRLRSLRIHHTLITTNTNNRTSLHPSHLPHLPHLHTLTLTNIPPTSPDSSISTTLIRLIESCAAKLQKAQLEATSTYTLPPGRNRALAEAEYAASQFALEHIVLELADEDEDGDEDGVKARGQNAADPRSDADDTWTQNKQHGMSSATQDPDSDALWRAAANDFSFFGADDTAAPPPLASRQRIKHPLLSSSPEHATIDTVAVLSAFRRERRAVFVDAEAEARRKGGVVGYVCGYWPGEIRVVRGVGSAGGGQRGGGYGGGW